MLKVDHAVIAPAEHAMIAPADHAMIAPADDRDVEAGVLVSAEEAATPGLAAGASGLTADVTHAVARKGPVSCCNCGFQ